MTEEKEYKTLLDITEEILNEKQNLDFYNLFNSIQKILLKRWRSESIDTSTDEEILLKKRGELYRLLTVDGRFFHNADGTWTTIRPDYKN
ncbi:DNA-directed RNA polymerase subunit delta [Mycoplasma sp. 2575]